MRHADDAYDREASDQPTVHILPVSLFSLARTHAKVLLARPVPYCAALCFAVTRRPPGFRALLWSVFYFLEAVLLWQRLSERGIRHVHVHFALAVANVAMIACRLGDLQYSLTVHGSTEFFNVDSLLLREKVERAEFVVCISDFCRAQVLSQVGDSHWAKLHVVHCGLDAEAYAAVGRPLSQDRPFVVLTVGRLIMVKGMGVLLRSLAELKRDGYLIRCYIVGDGPDRKSLMRLSERLELADCVSFVGSLDQSGLKAYYDDADVFVLPSYAEGLPVVLMEAMAKQLPVIATRITGVPELVRDGVSGLLVSPANVQELRKAISLIYSDRDLAVRLGEMGREAVVSGYNIRDIGLQLDNLFGTLIGSSDRSCGSHAARRQDGRFCGSVAQ